MVEERSSAKPGVALATALFRFSSSSSRNEENEVSIKLFARQLGLSFQRRPPLA